MYTDPFDQFASIGLLVASALFLLLGLAVAIAICVLLSGVLKRVPVQFREMEPGLVWLLLIPCFNLIWNFFVFPKTSRSLKAYFDSVGDNTVADCGGGLAMAYCILSVVSLVPYLGCLTGIASLVVLVIYLVKVNELKNRIPESAAGLATALGPNYRPPQAPSRG
jgi:hypothetical protein